jgi:hypothetical protein
MLTGYGIGEGMQHSAMSHDDCPKSAWCVSLQRRGREA